MISVERVQAWLKSRRVQGAIALVATLALWALLSPWVFSRDAEVHVRVENAGPAWRLDWEPALGVPRNGHWIDLEQCLRQPGPTFTTGEKPLVIRDRLATYHVDRVRVGWDNSPGARLTIEDVLVDDHIVFAKKLRRVHLRPMTVEGGEWSPTTACPVTVVCKDAAGGVWFECPPLAWWCPLLVAGFAAALVAGAWAALALLWWLAGAYDRWLMRRPAPEPTRRAPAWLAVATLAIIVGVPLWMCSWAPMIVSGDSTAYVLHAAVLLENGNFEHFDGWRLPGYAVTILPFLATMHDYAAGVGGAHAAMAILSALMAWDIARRRLPAPWPQLAGVLVAIDPALVLWQRTLMSEHQTSFLIMLSAWLLVLVGGALGDGADARHGPGKTWRTLGLCITLGAVLAAGGYTRGNLQIAAILAPCAIALIAWRVRRAWWWPAATCVITCAALLSPIFIFNARHFQRASLVIGTDWSRVLWAWEDGALDWNQSGIFTFDQFKVIRTRCAEYQLGSWQFTDLYQDWSTPSVPPGLAPWTQRDVRSRTIWKEAAARRGPRLLGCMVKGTAAMLGFPISDPPYFRSDVRTLLGPLLGVAGESPDHSNWIVPLSWFGPDWRPMFERTHHPLGNIAESWQASAMLMGLRAARAVRPVVTCLLLVASLRLLRRGDWACAGLAAILLVHAAALAVLVFTGVERYGVPWYGLMTVLVMIGLLWRPPAARTTPQT